MSAWLLLAIASQFLSAVSVVIDKHIVVRTRAIGEPMAYAYFTIIFSSAVAIWAVFGFVHTPTPVLLALSLANGIAFFIALYCLYSALRIARASDVAPAVSGISALVTIVLSAALHESDIAGMIVPAFLLAGGTAVISHFHFSRQAVAFVMSAGFAFGIAIFLAKLVFDRTEFFDGFFWMRMTGVVVAISMLAVPSFRRRIFRTVNQSTQGGWLLVTANKALSGASSIMFSLAVSLGSVAVVNAMTGLQFAFLFLFAILFAKYMPRETTSLAHGGWHTGLGVFLIVLGFGILAFSV